MKTVRLFGMVLALLLTVGPAAARDVEGIAAVVNDQVISLYDVDQRVDLFFATSGIEKSAEMTERMRQQVLRSLVDEKLQLQEATRVEIEIEEAEIEERMELLASNSMRSSISASSISISTRVASCNCSFSSTKDRKTCWRMRSVISADFSMPDVAKNKSTR